MIIHALARRIFALLRLKDTQDTSKLAADINQTIGNAKVLWENTAALAYGASLRNGGRLSSGHGAS